MIYHDNDCSDYDCDVGYKSDIFYDVDANKRNIYIKISIFINIYFKEASLPQQSLHRSVRNDKARVLHCGVLKHVVNPEGS